MQGLDLGSQHGSGYMDNLPDLASPGALSFDNLDGVPSGDNPNLWYDTDV